MEYPLYDFNDFNDFNDFDFMNNDNDIMVNGTTTSLSKARKEIIYLYYASDSLII